MAIERLSFLDTATGSLTFAVNVNGRDYQIGINEIVYFISSANPPPFTGIPQYETQYAVPSSTGFSVQVTNGDDNVHLILTPTAGFAAGTIVLPATPGAIDKQQVIVNCTQQVTALTINGNGAAGVTGEPTSLAADSFFTLKYDLPTQTWYRIG